MSSSETNKKLKLKIKIISWAKFDDPRCETIDKCPRNSTYPDEQGRRYNARENHKKVSAPSEEEIDAKNAQDSQKRKVKTIQENQT